MPVSSSSVMKQTPLALPGRWRISTSPAIDTRFPSRMAFKPVGGDEASAPHNARAGTASDAPSG